MNAKPIIYDKLSPNEQKHPVRAFEELFDFIDLPSIKEYLWLGLKTTATDSYKQLTKHEKLILFDIYERMEKVVEAAHILRNKRTRNT